MLLKCKNCNVELNFEKTLNIDFEMEGEAFIIKNVSFCPKCKTKYFWSDKYPNSEIEILKIEKTIDI